MATLETIREFDTTKIISRQDAISLGLRRYFTGNECKYGHISERLLSNNTCLVCAKAKTKEWYNKDPNRKITHDRNYRKRHPEYMSMWREQNPLWDKEYYNNNREKLLANAKTWRRNNKGIKNFLTAKRRTLKQSATPDWSETEKIKSLYEAAEYLTRLTWEKWDVDHIVPLKNKNVCGLHVYDNLQLLPHKDNIQKSNKFMVREVR